MSKDRKTFSQLLIFNLKTYGIGLLALQLIFFPEVREAGANFLLALIGAIGGSAVIAMFEFYFSNPVAK